MRARHKYIVSIPIMGVVTAGHPIPLPDADTPPLDILEIPRSKIVPAPGIFGLKVRGESMVDANINDGDTIIVKPQKSASNGDLVIARVYTDPTSTETTFKRFYSQGELVYLQPENAAYRPLIIEAANVEIIGVVLAVWRNHSCVNRHLELVE